MSAPFAGLLWYVSRGTGVAAVAALAGAALLGLLAQSRWQAPGWPRFLTAGLHRNVALVGFALVAVHVLAVVADGYVDVSLGDAVVPFAGSYRTWWVGVGALSFDLLLLVLITSALRRRLGYARWRRVHLASYACFALAIAHGLGVGTDAGRTWMLTLVALAALGVAAAAGRRFGATRPGETQARSRLRS